MVLQFLLRSKRTEIQALSRDEIEVIEQRVYMSQTHRKATLGLRDTLQMPV